MSPGLFGFRFGNKGNIKNGTVIDQKRSSTAENSPQNLLSSPCHYLADVIAWPSQTAMWSLIATRSESGLAVCETNDPDRQAKRK